MKLPELGENIEGGDVLRVMVNPGDAIKKDQSVLELETDKATIEVPSSVAGVIKEVKVKPGEKVKVGQTIFVDRRREGAGAAAAEGGRQGQHQRQPKQRPPKTAAPKPASGTGSSSQSREAQGRRRRDEAIASRRACTGAGSRAGAGGRRRVDSCGAFRAQAGARAGRRHPGHSGLRPGRPHLDGRRDGVRAPAARGCAGPPAAPAAASVARLQQVGSHRAQADERRATDDRSPADAGVEYGAARLSARSRGHHRRRGAAQAAVEEARS